MNFSYRAYAELIRSLFIHGYTPSNYHNWEEKNRTVILRHDIDNDVAKALKLAELEASLNVHSTYFVLVASDFYNVLSQTTKAKLKRIISLGHEVGLHFDEVQYPELTGDMGAIQERIVWESKFLEDTLGSSVRSVSMHRPSKNMLDADLQIPGIINSYGKTFFHDFKYLSDSRRRWREPVEEIIESEQYSRLHILTHAFWYENEDHSLEDTVFEFINRGSSDRYKSMKENITDLESIVPQERFLEK